MINSNLGKDETGVTLHEKIDNVILNTDIMSGYKVPIIIKNTVTLYNSKQATIFSITNDRLVSHGRIHLTFLSANAGDVITNLTWTGVIIDEVITNEVFNTVQHYVARVRFTSTNISLNADYSYNRSRSCYVFVSIS